MKILHLVVDIAGIWLLASIAIWALLARAARSMSGQSRCTSAVERPVELDDLPPADREAWLEARRALEDDA